MEHPEEPMLAGEAGSASEEVARRGERLVRGPPPPSWQQPTTATRGGEQPPGARLGFAHPITTHMGALGRGEGDPASGAGVRGQWRRIWPPATWSP